MPSPRPGAPAWGALAFYVAVAVAFAPDAATGAGTFWHHDLRHHHDPWRAWAAQTWLSGEVPWWAPGAANGFPLLAEGEGGFLYPPTMLLYALLPDGLALDWAILGHQVLAAMGLWAFLRARGLRGAPALLGGLAWAWGGFLVSHTLYLGMQNAAAWIGWGLFAAATGRAWLVAVCIGMMGLAGHPQAAAFGGLLLAIHAVATGQGWRWYAGAAAGAVLASPQLLATLDLARHSMREGGVSEAFAHIGALPVPELVKAVLPYAFGHDRPADVAQSYYHRGDGYWGPGVNAWETALYLGVPVAILAVIGLRRARGWGLVALVATVLMLGGPAWEAVRHLPGFDGFRFPARFALWLSLAVSVLAAHGLEVLRTARRPQRYRHAVLWLAALFPLATGLAHLGLRVYEADVAALLEGRFRRQVEMEATLPAPVFDDPFLAAALPPPEKEDPAAIPGKVARILWDLSRSTSPTSPRVLVPLGLLLATAACVRRPRALLVVAAADLWLYGTAFHPRVPTEETREAPRWLAEGMRVPGGPRLSVLDRRVDPRLDTQVLSSSLGLIWGTQDVFLPTPLLLLRNDAVLATAGLDIGEPGVAHVRRYLANLDVARRLGVRWVATTHRVPGLVPLVRGPVNVYVDPGALPRARVVPCVKGVPDGAAAFAALTAEDPRRTVLVEGGTDGCVEETGAAAIVRYANTEVEVAATGPGTLVLADTWFPGWTATLDDAPVDIARADVLFRAVTLPPGEHTVVFRYDPGTPRLALWAALGLAVVGGGGLLATRRRRARLQPESPG